MCDNFERMNESVDIISLPSNICAYNQNQLKPNQPSYDECSKQHQTIMKRQKGQQVQQRMLAIQQKSPTPPLSSMQNTDENPLTCSSSIIEFLNHEKTCLVPDNDSEMDIDSIFEEINRLSDDSDERSVDEILREAEILLSRQEQLELERPNGDEFHVDESITSNLFEKWKMDEHLKPISEESTPREMKSHHSDNGPADDVTVSRVL